MTAPAQAKTESRWKEQRIFGIAMGCALTLLGGILYWRGATSTAPWLWYVAGTMLVLGLVAPMVLWPVWKVWTTAVVPVINWILTNLLMGAVFFTLVTLIARLMALFGADPLDRKIEPERTSYWHAREPKPFDPEQCKKQF